MNKFFNISALAFAGLIAIAASAQAGGLYDSDDDYDTSRNYTRQSLSDYCYKHPYDDACGSYTKRDYRRKPDYSYGSYTVGRCAPLVRAVGKRNLFLGFARNSAMFAWAREARFVHGEGYGNWNNSRDAHIECTRIGGLNSCEATAKPCL
jgi:hypothetical protein